MTQKWKFGNPLNAEGKDDPTREWEFGTTLSATVHSVDDGNPRVIMLEDENGDTHILVSVDRDVSVHVGKIVTLQLREGGPEGAYWDIKAVNDLKK